MEEHEGTEPKCRRQRSCWRKEKTGERNLRCIKEPLRMRQEIRRRMLPLHRAPQGSHGSPPGPHRPPFGHRGPAETRGQGQAVGSQRPVLPRSAGAAGRVRRSQPPHCDLAGALGEEAVSPCVTRTAGSPMTAAGQNLLQSQALRLGRAAPAPGTGAGASHRCGGRQGPAVTIEEAQGRAPAGLSAAPYLRRDGQSLEEIQRRATTSYGGS